MKKVFLLEDLGCANCAAKMEEKIKQIDGVSSANVSFMTQKLTLDAEEKELDKIMKQVKKTIKKIEPDVSLTAL